MSATSEIIERIELLANLEYDEAESILMQIPFPGNLGFLMEACRLVDAVYIQSLGADVNKEKNNAPYYETIKRGWNPLVSILLKKTGEITGVPIRESTEDIRKTMLAILHQLGRVILLRHVASMLRHDLVDAYYSGERIIVSMGKRLQTDHFADQLEYKRMDKFKKAMGVKPGLMATSILSDDDLNKTLNELLFPYDTGHGIIIGYNSTPELDYHYLAVIEEIMIEWQEEAGIHPAAKFQKITGGELVVVASLLVSFRLKHKDFVMAGMKRIPDANYYMCLPIWLEPNGLIASISEFTRLPLETVRGAIDILTLKPDQTKYFESETTPFMPLLIEISPGYCVAPVSSIFRNPLTGIRMFHEINSLELQQSIKKDRENWMIDELYGLFQGDRYVCSEGTSRLKKDGKTVTDIDAAILDVTTGNLALFQLKWQDHGTNLVRKQVSKAKNFVSQIDEWTVHVTYWTTEFGKIKLASSLRLQSKTLPPINDVFLFGIGRLASRFNSYGQSLKSENIAVCNWDQFVRIRHESGPSENIFSVLQNAMRNEYNIPENISPIPYEMRFRDQLIFFEDMWNTFNEEK